MHYIPESTTEMLRGETSCCAAARPNFHYQSAPLYLLTATVAAMLAADWVLSVASTSAASSVQPLGMRWALLAALIGGSRILYHTLDGLLSGRFGADLALTLACLAAILLGEHQTAGMVVLISLIGESVEGYTVDRARLAVSQTFSLCPSLAHRNVDGREQDIPVDEVCVGDIVTVRPGERLPVDGQVVAGASVVDQSPFTGESEPVDKRPGDLVLAGTLNQFGALTIVAKSIGENTALARVAQLVGTALTRKAQMEHLADRLARWFLPAVVSAAIVTLVGWRLASGSWQAGYLSALGVLVVACPCPLILATPCAVMASLAWLARRGVVVKGSAVLERLAEVDTFAFDKTGTLTQGDLALGDIIPTTGLTDHSVLRLAAIAERHSEHPLARLIVKAAEVNGLSIPAPSEFETHAGAGVVAKISTRDLVDLQHPTEPPVLSTIIVGNRRALNQGEIAFLPDVDQQLKEREAAGESPLAVALNGTVVGVVALRETIRPESRQILEQLRELGIHKFALLTGDRPLPTDAVFRSLGLFDEVAAEQLPADKANWVESARRAGRRVAMVGDGINDAPALAAADVGMAIGRAGSDLAAAAGEIILLGEPLHNLPAMVRLSRALVQNIWQSIVLFAFGLNALGVLACSFRWLDPIGGALFHEFASLAVMANAMRLLWFEGRTDSSKPSWLVCATQSLDRLIAHLSPSQWVFWSLDHWKLVARIMVAALLGLWFLSGVAILTEDEQALVTRFGRYEATLTAGLHWRWPWPLERIARVQVNRIRSVPIGYRERVHSDKRAGEWSRTSRSWTSLFSGQKPSVAATAAVVEWTSDHDDRDRATTSAESVMLTADEVPVEMMAEVLYRINNLKDFVYLGSQRPDAVLRATAESVLREVAASESLDSLLTERRADLEQRSSRLLRQRIDRQELGIEIINLQWLDVHPPQPVVPAYRQVAEAMEERELLINEADADALKTLLTSVGEQALALLQQAARQQDPQRSRDTSPMNWQLNDDLWWQLTQQDSTEQLKLSGSAAAILNDGHTRSVRRELEAQGEAQRFEALLVENLKHRQLTRLQLYWSQITRVLAQRALMIIDPQVTGRKHLWLGNSPPETQLPPAPN